ncbi:peptidoglycan O-acetyltransferase [Pseudomonas fluorescens]|uniref:acyltransferase family protein n=1 Tax=Pseudomonas fluorescens TaxID=294 RepID=UPI0005E1A044|nr:acyltransferase family protein [Pseudomonas fluorescens]KJH87160.1 peptidoglycan O-acetyltransferase [Pseudomonas fluorescens]
MNYRSDIDGLRAIAVLSVVIYHLNIGLLSGGFVGVDIFFVISGYLISKIIYSEVEAGTFSIANFYVRRARRILPAFLSVIIASSIAAYCLLYPSELVNYAESAIAAGLFSANIYFYATLNYFSPSADEIPLLHLWSLGIEEQFYIFFPILIIGLSKISKRLIPAAIILTLAASLFVSQRLLSSDPAESFYLLPFRAFELLIGSLIALPAMRLRLSPATAYGLFVVGVIALVYSIFFYSSNIPFPGVAAALPCVGAALIIMVGEQGGRMSLLLGSRPMVFFGKISYSLYLIHWPLIVFSKRAFPDANEETAAIYIFITATILALVNYRLVERPFRQRRPASGNKSVLIRSAVALGGVVAISGFVSHKNGFPEPSDERLKKALDAMSYNSRDDYLSGRCFLDETQRPDAIEVETCLPKTKLPTRAVIYGDSHAIQFYSGLKPAFEKAGVSLGALTASSCPPYLGVDIPGRPYCKLANYEFLQKIREYQPDIFIITSSWYPAPEFMAGLRRTLEAVDQIKLKRVIVIGQTPTYKRSVPGIVIDRINSNNLDRYSENELDQDYIDNGTQAVIALVKEFKGMQYVSAMDALCPAGRCPLTTPDGYPLLYDNSHFTIAGSEFAAKELAPVLLSGTKN